MGRVKKLERSSKRGLMRALGRLLRARPMSFDDVRALSPRSVLVIRQQNQMGDMILAVPALRAVRAACPGARIGVLTSTLNRGVLEHQPFVDTLFTYDKRGPMGHLGLIRALRRERYDLVILLHTVSFSFTSLMLGVLSGARVRVGSTSHAVGDALTGSYLNCTLPLPTEGELASMNEAEHNLFPLAAIGVTTDNIAPSIVPDDAARAWADEYARSHWGDGANRLIVHPGAGKVENIWPVENFARVVEDVMRQAGVGVTVIEGPSDAPVVSRFLELCNVGIEVVRGRRILEVAALLTRATLVLCNDTGIMHVSAAAGANTLAVFGPTDPHRWAPRCSNLHVVRSSNGTLSDITPSMVEERALELLRR